MKVISYIILLLSFKQAFAIERQYYYEDHIYNFTENTISFLGGSTWEVVGTNYFPLGASIILFENFEANGKFYRDFPVLYINRSAYAAYHISGSYHKSSGYIGEVVSQSDEGSKLQLSSGEVVSVMDSFISNLWLPPYRLLLSSNMDFAYNIDASEKVYIYSVE